MYSIRKATGSDVARMIELFEKARGIMRADGNLTQWADGYPSEDVLRADIQRGNSYVICEEDGTVKGTFAFIIGEDPTYRTIYGGKWLDDTKQYGTIHRLASGPESHGIAKAGFSLCGTIHLLNGDPRLAYQKLYGSGGEAIEILRRK